jgi:molybdopterin-binding protein
MELLRPVDAARELGVSYPTLKQWIYKRQIRSVKTPGGHHRIPRPEIERLLFRQEAGRVRLRTRPAQGGETPSASGATPAGLEHMISGRNQLVGRVTAVQKQGLLAKVSLDVGGQTITAIITRDACRDLRLKPGTRAAALIKATEVMIIRPSGPASSAPLAGAKR